MKQKLLKTLVLLCALIVGSATSWADDVIVTFNSSTDVGTGTAASGSNSVSKDGITISCTAGGFAISGGAHYRLASSSTTTISSTVGNIKKIVISGPSGTGNYSISKFGTNSGWTLNTTAGTATWTGDEESVTISARTGQVRPTSIAVTYTPTAGASSIATPTFSVAGGTYITTQSVELDCETEGATIRYTLDGNEPNESSTEYTSAIAVATTTTIKAKAFKGEDASNVVTATYTILPVLHAGTDADPYTVADARNAIDANTGLTNVYVTGIVCEGGSSLSSGAMNYWISDDGSETDKFEIYKGKGLDGANFTATSDVQEGDVVVVYGNITKYNNTTYEFSGGSQIYSFNRPGVATHKISWSVNGAIVKTDDVEEGAAIDFAAPTSGIPNGYAFQGWVKEANKIDTPTDTDPSANYVTSATSTADVTYYAVMAIVKSGTPASWTETSLASLTASDVFVLSNGTYAMNNDGGTSNQPTVNSITVSDGKITSEVADNLKWQVSGNDEDGYTFYPNGSTTTWMYCNTTASSGSNNNIRVGTGDRKVWIFDTNGYLVTNDTYTDRYLSIYNDQDFRGYTSNSSAFVPKFYKYVPSSIVYKGYCTSAKVSVTVSAVGFATLFTPAALDFSGVTGLTAYTAVKDGDVVRLTQVDDVPANTGVVLEGDAGTYSIPAIATSTTAKGELKGNATEATAWNAESGYTYYVLASTGSGVEFRPVTSGEIAAGKAFLKVAANSVHAFNVVFGDETGISETMRDGEKESAIFDLSGRRVAKPVKGLYIVNGKKIMVK